MVTDLLTHIVPHDQARHHRRASQRRCLAWTSSLAAAEGCAQSRVFLASVTYQGLRDPILGPQGPGFGAASMGVDLCATSSDMIWVCESVTIVPDLLLARRGPVAARGNYLVVSGRNLAVHD